MRRIPIKIHPLFWVFAFLIGWLNSGGLTGALIWTIIILISVLVHECGHAITAIAFGQKVRIQLVAFGGLTLRHGPKLKPWQDFIVVLCGPLAGFMLFFLCRALLPLAATRSPTFLFALQVATTVNLIWTLLNLLPIMPLDGGKLFSIILESIFGFKGLKAALIISVGLGFVLSLISFVFNQLFLGILFFLLAYESLRSTRYMSVMSDQDRSESLQSLLKKAQHFRSIGDENQALSLYRDIRTQSKKGIIYATATEAAAQMLAEKGNADEGALKEAYELLLSLPSLSPDSKLLFHRLAYQVKDYEQVIKKGNDVYQLFPSYETALLNAASYASLGNAEPAVGWLECAVREGVPNIEPVLMKKEFDRIRNEPLFSKFLETVQKGP
jgi:stage IV sporulation protein FB